MTTNRTAARPGLPLDFVGPGELFETQADLDAWRAREGRNLTPISRRLLDSATTISPDTVGDIGFQHALLCQAGLPYRCPPLPLRVWERHNGLVTLRIDAGSIVDPATGHFVDVPLPSGTRSRLIMIHLHAEALRTQSPVIDVGRSLTSFLRQLVNRTPDGREVRRFKNQLTSLAAATIRLAFRNGRDGALQFNGHFMSSLELWSTQLQGERVHWPTTVKLSDNYYQSLAAHAVPLDRRAVSALAHSALALDIYAWLVQRLCRIPEDAAPFVSWSALFGQFGQGFHRIGDFRRNFVMALHQVGTVYQSARRIEEEEDSHRRPTGLRLHHGAPAVYRRRSLK